MYKRFHFIYIMRLFIYLFELIFHLILKNLFEIMLINIIYNAIIIDNTLLQKVLSNGNILLY